MLVANAPVTPRPTGAALVHRSLDGWLVGGIGIVLWFVIAVQRALGGGSLPAVQGAVYWAVLTLTAAHFGVTYHLGYAGGLPAVRRHWIGLALLPGLLAAVVVATWVGAAGAWPGVARHLVRGLLLAVFTLTGWHYIKQAYGVARIGAAGAGLRLSTAEARVLRFGLYPIWAVDLILVYVRGRRTYAFGLDLRSNVLPVSVDGLARAVAVVSAVVLAGLFVRLARRHGAVPPAAMWTPYAVAFLWFGLEPDYVSAAFVLAGLHALQYLACAHRAEVAWARERREPRLASWWVAVFGGAAAGGLLLSSWLPRTLDALLAPQGAPLLFAATMFAFLNLHHYAVDAVIWRSSGDHVRRMLGRR